MIVNISHGGSESPRGAASASGSGAFCSATCQKEIDRQDALIDRTGKRKQKKRMEEPDEIADPQSEEAQETASGGK